MSTAGTLFTIYVAVGLICMIFALSGAMASQASSDWGVFGGMAMMLGFTSYVLAGLVFITNFLQDSPAPAKKEPIQLPETTRGK